MNQQNDEASGREENNPHEQNNDFKNCFFCNGNGEVLDGPNGVLICPVCQGECMI